jgi:hypothetical protein
MPISRWASRAIGMAAATTMVATGALEGDGRRRSRWGDGRASGSCRGRWYACGCVCERCPARRQRRVASAGASRRRRPCRPAASACGLRAEQRGSGLDGADVAGRQHRRMGTADDVGERVDLGCSAAARATDRRALYLYVGAVDRSAFVVFDMIAVEKDVKQH